MQLPGSSQGQNCILAGKLFDPYTKQFITDQLITICPLRGIITSIRTISLDEQESLILTEGEKVIDLRQQTVLPGFVDAHVHFFLRPYSEKSWSDQLTRESIIERTVRAVTHAKKTLLAGFTTVRRVDLGTEGAGDADIVLRKCLSGPDAVVPGPRYFCANRAIVATGSYGPRGVHALNVEGVEGITGAEVVDGKEGCRAAVRRQVGAGADWIKIYADYSARSRLSDVCPRIAAASVPTFHPDELKEMISTATTLGVKTTMHLNEDITATILQENNIIPHSIEHGTKVSDERLQFLRNQGVHWIPTLAVFYTNRLNAAGAQRWEEVASTFRRALKIDGLKVACGGDTGVFPHGENALEMKLMIQLGADWRSVLQWSTLSGWECVRGMQWEGQKGKERIARIPDLQEDVRVTGDNDMPFGAIKKGFAADIIATRFDLEDDFGKAVDPDSISFVMKGGKIFKRDGKEVPY